MYDRRWALAIAARTELNVAAIEAEAVWGKEANDKIALLDKSYVELFEALRTRHSLLKKQSEPYQTYTPADAEWMQKYEAIVYMSAGNDHQNEYEVKLSNAIEEIEKYVRAKIKR